MVHVNELERNLNVTSLTGLMANKYQRILQY